ncbi:hypothetical protein [Sphingomonas nostoxanthinifaciens]|uniref:hypothetical protein n=1 Tax=Sphingomonas nostoxanthinifaciens TaxID=2872652 RepID=UPI001CC1D19A|nr:hypothetical protein [Sphingomonas nostoxanthinifaciens]UAK24347.1 hypothetical protein K8P63_18875 [Sphingomonas nostoxanthinifaciens]
MISTSTREPVPFTPAWREGRPDAPRFFLRAGSVIERGHMEAELAGEHRAGKVYPWEVQDAVKNGILTLLAEDPELDHLLQLVEEEVEGGTIGDGDKRLLQQTRNILAEHWPEYRNLLAKLERRKEVAPIVALARYCTGWENCLSDRGEPAPFATGKDGLVSPEALMGLASLDMVAAGNQAYLLQYGAGQAGNSARPSQSDDGQTTSGSDLPSAKAGKSATTAGKKTRGSPSRRGSGRS